MENNLLISNLNDFIFCPVSIYFHNLYGNMHKETYQSTPQILGSQVHKSIDNKTYNNKKDVYQSMDVYSDKYGICGKIDLYDSTNRSLIERKRKITTVYDGFIFQLYAQYYCLLEMGYEVETLFLYSYLDNKKYSILLPDNNEDMKAKFNKLIDDINQFNLNDFVQTNQDKCRNCIYLESCDRGVL